MFLNEWSIHRLKIIKMIAILLSVTASVVLALPDRNPCLQAEKGWHDPQRELCCNFGITDRFNEHGQELDCCHNTTYIPETEICCGKYAFVKIGKDGKVTKCCGVFPYVPSDNTQICCSNRLHEWKSDLYGCCGNLLNNKQSQVCCSDGNGNKKQHMIAPRKKCCGQEYYSKKTHHCHGGRHVLPIYTELCGTAEYDTRKQKCCDVKLYNISESSPHYKCCGSSLYNDIEQKCCGQYQILIPKSAECCKKGYYYKETQRCCGGFAVNFDKESDECCGAGLHDTQYQDCCGTTPYNTSTYECCKPNGAIIRRGTNYKCCGLYSYDSEKDVCCVDDDDFSQEMSQVKTKATDTQFHDMCCPTSLIKEWQSYSSVTHRCLQNGTVIDREDMCGEQKYNSTRDLCCNGVMDERGTEKGRGCCGIKSYHKTSQICCDNMVYFIKDRHRCNEVKGTVKKRTLPDRRSNVQLKRRRLLVRSNFHLYHKENYGICQYCFNDEAHIIRSLKSGIDICKHKGLRIKVLNETRLSDKVMVKGALRKNLFSKVKYRGTIDIQLPCSCILDTRIAILLTDLEDYSKPLRLGDSDIILPWTRKINNLIKQKLQICQKDITKVALDYVSKIKTYVDFTSTQLKIQQDNFTGKLRNKKGTLLL